MLTKILHLPQRRALPHDEHAHLRCRDHGEALPDHLAGLLPAQGLRRPGQVPRGGRRRPGHRVQGAPYLLDDLGEARQPAVRDGRRTRRRVRGESHRQTDGGREEEDCQLGAEGAHHAAGWGAVHHKITGWWWMGSFGREHIALKKRSCLSLAFFYKYYHCIFYNYLVCA